MRNDEWNYSSSCCYFITICSDRRRHYFGHVLDEEMICNELGSIVKSAWCDLSSHYSNVKPFEFVVMPDHFHGIVCLEDDNSKLNLSTIVGGFKSEVSRKIHKIDPKFQWQRGFHDKIIYRHELYDRFVEYIHDNPRRWNSRR